MLNVQIDEAQFKELYLDEVRKRIKEIEADLSFWDRKELMRQTCLSWGTIQERFFFDPRFPKHKVGGKWIFPASKTREFLLQWLSEQPNG